MELESKPPDTAAGSSSSRRDSDAAAATSTSTATVVTTTSSRGSCGRLKAFVQRWLTTLTLVGAALGVATGILCKALLSYDDAKRCPTDPEPEPHDFVKVLSFPGQLWVRALKLMVVPMIFASMIVSVSAVSKLGSTNAMASLAIRFYMATTVCAAITGIVLFNVFKASFAQMGELNTDDNCTAAAVASQEHAVDSEGDARLTILDTLLKFGFDLVPDNLVAALYKSQLLGVITFAIFFGTMLEAAPHGQVVVHFFEATFATFVAMIKLVILFTPIGVGSLVAGSIATSSQLELVLGNLGALFGVVLLGQVWHSLAFYGGCYFAAIGSSPLKYFAGLPRAWVTAFGTSSSAATLSTTSRCCEALGVSKEAINFVLPIGCTVNMDGSALERPIVVLWIAHCAGFPLSRRAARRGAHVGAALDRLVAHPVGGHLDAARDGAERQRAAHAARRAAHLLLPRHRVALRLAAHDGQRDRRRGRRRDHRPSASEASTEDEPHGRAGRRVGRVKL